ncbi:YbaN family protein [Novosphingobium sp. 1949]|uniref:YbaN family protein n=1 Tax=Novosphingobium organovorum TaxID=2930092 RepID=A0ABT0BJM5_9SPHN|nr:YbaN family protein [Novosphingobium organovorum]MCJ2185058.1 YbaN family protein [Novosphingobium organovorum]
MAEPSLAPGETEPGPQLVTSRVVRTIWLGAGLALIGLGVIGLFLPLVPTFDFLILALPCLARSSPRLESWLLNHPRLGPGLKAWKENRAVTRTGKRMAILGMSAGFALFVIHARPSLFVAVAVGLAMGTAALWVISRPEAKTSNREKGNNDDSRG